MVYEKACRIAALRASSRSRLTECLVPARLAPDRSWTACLRSHPASSLRWSLDPYRLNDQGAE